MGLEQRPGGIFQALQHSRERDDDEEGAVDPLMLHEVRDEGDGLDGFPQSHLVRQDPVEVVVVQGHEPFQAFDLRECGWGLARRWESGQPPPRPAWARANEPVTRLG